MKKKVVSTLVAGVITISPFLSEIGNAETLDNIQEKQDKIEEHKEEIQQEMDKIDEQSSDLEVEITKLDKSIIETKGNIEQKEEEIEQQKKEINKVKEEIQTLNEQIEKRTEVLKSRAVAYQQSGGVVSYLQVLLDSQSFSDFIGRVDAVGKIMSADRGIMDQQENDLLLVEEKKKEESEKQVTYEKELESLKELEDFFYVESAEKEKLLKKLESEKQVELEEFLEMEKEEEFLKEQELAIKKAAEEAAQKEKEEELNRNIQEGKEKELNQDIQEDKEDELNQDIQEDKEDELNQDIQEDKEEELNQNIQEDKEEELNQAVRSSQSNNSVESTPTITDGLFMRPANGPTTSEFGRRTLNGSADDHPGIDIGKRGENVPVVAAADGVVIRSDYSTSYGNVVYITHNLNGKVYTTVYAHMDSRSVQTGETVKKGQTLGMMGNTGYSFGAHLHFEIHEGEWNLQKSNAVDPRKYINF